MDAITLECFNGSPIKDLTNPELLELVYNSQHFWYYSQRFDGTYIKDYRAFRTEFNQCCNYFFENKNYYTHLVGIHPSIQNYADAVRELAMEKVNNG
jgi:hypothetical protein